MFEEKAVEVDFFHEVAGEEAHMVELREAEDVAFQQHGRGNVQLAADIEEVLQKVRIGELFFVFVHELLHDLAVFYRLCPYFEHSRALRRKFPLLFCYYT